MNCASCSSGGNSPRGCRNNGTCSSGGCNKLEVYDWLANISLPSGQIPYDIVEVRFKNSRKEFYRNVHKWSLQAGDIVVVEATRGFDVGVVSVVGELARIQVNKKESQLKPLETKKILRIANQDDISKWTQARMLEKDVMFSSRTLAVNLGLEMKISDVEYQADLTKATFYYTANGRVDFRQLIRNMATEFRIRIEMRQIGVRQEAARLGAIGACGRDLCCSTWLTDFRTVSTSAARYQQMSLNAQKLSGQCGKLKCCLNFELDMYLEELKSFPKHDTKIYTEKGMAYHVKTDVFKHQMWYAYAKGVSSDSDLIPLSPEQVKEIVALNKEGVKPKDLSEYAPKEHVEVQQEYENVVGQDSLERFEHIFKSKKRKRNKRPQQSVASDKNREQNRQAPPAQTKKHQSSAKGKSLQHTKARSPKSPTISNKTPNNTSADKKES